MAKNIRMNVKDGDTFNTYHPETNFGQVLNSNGKNLDAVLVDGTTSNKGLVQLTDSTASTSITTAATPKSVKAAYDLANGKANKTLVTALADGLMSKEDKAILDDLGAGGGVSEYQLPTSSATVLGGVKTGTNIVNSGGTISVSNGSTATKGVVQLTDSIVSTSITTAATSKSVKDALDAAKSHTDTTVANLVGSAPTTLDTLKEIADAITEADGVVDGLITTIGNKASSSDLQSHSSDKRFHKYFEGDAGNSDATGNVEGYETAAEGLNSHAEGLESIARGPNSHAEGAYTMASGDHSHAEGFESVSNGWGSHAEGNATNSFGESSHTEGDNTSSYGRASHAEGFGSTTVNGYHHTMSSQTLNTKTVVLHDPLAANVVVGDTVIFKHASDPSTVNSNETTITSIDATRRIIGVSVLYNTGNLYMLVLVNKHVNNIASHTEGMGTVANGRGSHAEGYFSIATGDSSHVEGSYSKAYGSQSHAEGSSTTASGDCSHSEGKYSTATGIASHAEGYSNTASGDSSHAEGEDSSASGRYSHAEGYDTSAGGNGSHAEGTETRASGNFSHAEGNGSIASGTSSHAQGVNTEASATASHAEGSSTVASGTYSHAQGSNTQASGMYSHAGGEYSLAGVRASTVIGRFNKALIGSPDTASTTNDLFVVGNGASGAARSNAFRVRADGSVYGLSAFNSTGADYAEFFEWIDGNISNEDRVGLFVTLEGEKIRKATSQDDYIVGIVSVNPSVIGDSYQDDWNGKYITDVWGRIQTEEEHVPDQFVTVNVEKTREVVDIIPIEVVDPESGEVTIINQPTPRMEKYTDSTEVLEIAAHVNIVPKLNPTWDSNEEYIPREERKEWSPIGLMGKLLVRDDGTCEVDGYAKSNDDGIATSSETGYRVMKRISENIVQLFIK